MTAVTAATDIPSDPTDRLCRTCTHYRPPDGRLDYAVCQAQAVATDLVTGAALYGLACAVARDRTGRCGVAGTWWRPAEGAGP